MGKSKAEAAANFVNNRVAGVQVHPFLGKMQGMLLPQAAVLEVADEFDALR